MHPLADADAPPSKIHQTLAGRLGVRGEPAKAWVLFTDKGIQPRSYAAALTEISSKYNARALHRRQLRRTRPGLVDADDLPVSPSYIDQVAACGASIHVASKWVNGVSVIATRQQLECVERLPFVRIIQPVRQAQRIEPVEVDEGPFVPPTNADAGAVSLVLDYGESLAQLQQINLVALHNAGYTASGVIVGILDTGFERSHVAFNEPTHPLTVVAEHDFVSNDGDTSFNPADDPTQHRHGTMILGTLGAYKPGQLVGGAFDASFVLCKTEDNSQEVPAEEDNYVAGLEFIELHGGDMATASLGYIDWYTQADLDGMTAVTTVAVNVATANGLYCVNAAGNGGHDSNPATSNLIAPADAVQVLACGAVDNTGIIAGFSSDGPTADGRVKPEVLARGSNTRTVNPSSTTTYLGVSGTSLSTPLVAGAMACLIEAHPTWTVQQMRTYLMLTASDYVANHTYDATYVRGYGIINAFAASAQDCNANGNNDLSDIAMGTPDCNGNSIPDACDLATNSRNCNGNSIPDECEADCNGNMRPDDCDIAAGFSDCDANAVLDVCQAPDPSTVGACCHPNGTCSAELPANCTGGSDFQGLCSPCAGVSCPQYNPPLPAPPPHDRTKNRYISFSPNNPGTPVRFTVSRGSNVIGWVAPPDANGISGVAPVATPPALRLWNEPVVHVGDCEIVPVETYHVQESHLPDALALVVFTTAQPGGGKLWGDTVGSFTGGEWDAPNGVVNVNDFQSILQKFLGAATAPHITVCDVQSVSSNDPCLNRVANVADVFLIIKAFLGSPYPFTVNPASCPPCP